MGRPLPVVRDVIDGYVLPEAVSIWPDMAGVMAAMRRARTAFVFIADSRHSLLRWCQGLRKLRTERMDLESHI